MVNLTNESAWRKAVLKAGECYVCGSFSDLTAHHLIPRQHKKLFLDTRNGCCLCGFCHVQYHEEVRFGHKTYLSHKIEKLITPEMIQIKYRG